MALFDYRWTICTEGNYLHFTLWVDYFIWFLFLSKYLYKLFTCNVCI